jgi:hypothetical protein
MLQPKDHYDSTTATQRRVRQEQSDEYEKGSAKSVTLSFEARKDHAVQSKRRFGSA